jgi:hypothetical protein
MESRNWEEVKRGYGLYVHQLAEELSDIVSQISNFHFLISNREQLRLPFILA